MKTLKQATEFSQNAHGAAELAVYNAVYGALSRDVNHGADRAVYRALSRAVTGAVIERIPNSGD